MIDVEQSEVRFGRTRIPYAIRRSERRSTVSIFVDPWEGVLLTAPRTATLDRLDRVVHQKAAWIVDRLRRTSELPPPLPARDFVSGETFLYLGRQYRLRIDRSAPADVAMVAGRLVVGQGDEDQTRQALVRWFRRQAERRVPEHVMGWATKLDVEPAEVLVRDQKKRWGSCDSRGIVRINWRTVQLPVRLLDYVVAHELVHLLHADHTRTFWAVLGRVMPDYEDRREALRTYGARLDWSVGAR